MTATARVPSSPALSAEGRALLQQRLLEVEERVPRLEQELAAWPEDPHTAVVLLAAREEATRLRSTLAAAVALEDQPEDPLVVEAGDTVTIRRSGTRTTERYRIVYEPEARLDDTWISAASPLAAALLGRGPGDVVDVQTPDGLVRYEIMGVLRIPS